MSVNPFCSAVEIAKAIREGAISSSELLEIYLSRIEKYRERVNAVVTVDVEGARLRAKRADEARSKGQSLGPLHGVPVTIKDAFETVGLRTTSGSRKLKEYYADTNAVAVQRYIDAGAVIFGKTNVPLFCADVQAYNDLFGTTNNPWDITRTPGGSSGGAAAAVAAGLTGLELGSDIAGSIRIPASWTGVYGHKPSYRLVPMKGHIPPPAGALFEPDLVVAGPLARSAADLMLALDILAGPDSWEAVGWNLTLPKPRAASLRKYRVAAWLEDPAIPMDTEVRDCLQSVVGALGRAGVSVNDRARPDIDVSDALRTYQTLMYPVMAAGFPQPFIEKLEELKASGDQSSELVEFARDVTASHRQWLVANAKRAICRAQWAEFFKAYDVLLCPAVNVPAIVHDSKRSQIERTVSVNGRPESYSITQRWAGLTTMVYLPATGAPIGRTKEGLPVGVQIVGPYLEDRTPIDFADKLSKVIGGFEPPPGFLP